MRDILLITIDSLRCDHIGYYGYDRDTTPFLDEFANSAHCLTNAYANACITRLSFPTILTSSYPSMYGGPERISEDRTLVAEVLEEGNHVTGGFHSNLFLSADAGYDRGFKQFYDSKTDPGHGFKLKEAVRSRISADSRLHDALGSVLNSLERLGGINFGSPYVNAENITKKALSWVKKTHSNENPRFLWVHYMDPHHPYVPPSEHQLTFREDPIGERRAIQLRRKMIEEPDEVTESELDCLLDLYDAEVRYTDSQISRLVTTVTEQWGEDIVVLITADHGDEFGEHGGFGHDATFYDEVIHVPLLIDDGSGGEVYNEIAALIDIPPTVTEYAGLDQPANFHGQSLKRLFDGRNWGREYVIGEDVESNEITKLMYRDKEWKYITDFQTSELYDLSEDPGEANDVADSQSNVRTEIESIIEGHRKLVAEHAGDREEMVMDDTTKQRLQDLGYMK